MTSFPESTALKFWNIEVHEDFLLETVLLGKVNPEQS